MFFFKCQNNQLFIHRSLDHWPKNSFCFSRSCGARGGESEIPADGPCGSARAQGGSPSSPVLHLPNPNHLLLPPPSPLPSPPLLQQMIHHRVASFLLKLSTVDIELILRMAENHFFSIQLLLLLRVSAVDQKLLLVYFSDSNFNNERV